MGATLLSGETCVNTPAMHRHLLVGPTPTSLLPGAISLAETVFLMIPKMLHLPLGSDKAGYVAHGATLRSSRGHYAPVVEAGTTVARYLFAATLTHVCASAL